MPSIAEAMRSSRSSERRRLLAGVGLVLVGALLVGLGAAGAVRWAPPSVGLVVGAVAVVASLGALASRAPLRAPERALVAAGAALATASGLFGWAVAPEPLLAASPLSAAGALGYLAGVAVMLAALLAGVTMRDGRRTPRTDGPRISWTRSDNGSTGREQVADGGAIDDGSFPLEDD